MLDPNQTYRPLRDIANAIDVSYLTLRTVASQRRIKIWKLVGEREAMIRVEDIDALLAPQVMEDSDASQR